MRKSICIILTIILMLGVHTGVRAKDNCEKEQNYIVSVLKQYVDQTKHGLERVKVSQSFKIHGSDERINMYLVLDGSQCIGELLVAETDPDVFYSSYYEFSNPQLDAILYSEEPILFFLINDTIAIQCGNEAYYMGSGLKVSTTETSEKGAKEKAVFKEVVFSDYGKNVSSKAGNSCSLSVPIISNASINGKGLCWAACSAMIGNYRTEIYRSATDLFSLLQRQYGGTPYGDDPWYQRAFRTYDLVYYKEDGGMHFFSLLSILQWNRPIIFSVRQNWYSFTWHDIVLRGLDGGNEYAVYSFADPNFTSGYLYVQVSDVSGASFPIVTNSGIYTIWKATRY